jgi:hypothetical protein
MSIVWDIIHIAASYAKVIEYAIVIGALVASLYAKKRISLASREIRASVHASAEELRQGVEEITGDLELKFAAAVSKLKQDMGELRASAVEGRNEDEDDKVASASRTPTTPEPGLEADTSSARPLGKHAEHRAWWQPIVEMKFDDPQQPQPQLFWKNNVRTPLAWPETWLTAWRNIREDGVCGVALSGKQQNIESLWWVIRRDAKTLESKLPKGSTVDRGRFGIRLTKPNSEFASDDERRAWLKANLNAFVNVLAPFLKDHLLSGSSRPPLERSQA